MKPLHLAMILAIDVVWGFNVVAVKEGVMSAGPMTAVLLRYVVATLVCLPFLRWLPGRMGLILLTGFIAGALFMSLGAMSFALADNVSALAIVGQLGVPFSLILAVIFMKEEIRWPRITAIAICFAGVVVLGFDPAIANERVGILLTAAASLCWAVGNLLFRRLQGVPVLVIHGWLGLVSIPIMIALAQFFEPAKLAAIPDLPLGTWGWVAYSGIMSSLVGHGGMTWLFQRYPVAVVSPLTLPTPLISISIAVAVYDTPITGQMLVGGLLTLVGVAIITIRTAQRRDSDMPVEPT
ncbi:DMT family transporter [Sandarakinorhabdus sp. AAP62]|uniref:DMT family transporter n=1 Tax=Sandarakinorhabdus sp. AAP62 TaxID=1248916 RepID=UPI0002D6BDDE|nr:DMT family transporter [Sandarakinorhabdus sp. AAP62]